MSDAEKSVENTDEAPTTAPPAVPGTEGTTVTTSSSVKDDIPAADADVKDEEQNQVQAVNGKSEEKKTPEPPKDPKEDPIGWIGSLFPAAVHKVNHIVLDWMQKLAIDEEDKRQPLPGKNDSVTKNQFLGFLRDGTLLAKLANRLYPGAIETIHEGEEVKQKDKQVSNVEAFVKFAKDTVGLNEQQVFKSADLLERGKSGYQSVFNTVMQLGMRTQEKFQQEGLDIDHLVQVASQAVQSNLIQTILNFFRRARPTPSPKQLAKEAEEKEKAEKAAAAEKVVEEKTAEAEEVCKKVESQTGVEPAAVVAN